MMKRRLLIVLFVLCASSGLMLFGDVPASSVQAATPTMTLLPKTAVAGQTVTAVGANLPVKSFGALFWGAQEAVIAAVQTKQDGSFQTAFVVPAGPSGSYRVTARVFRGGTGGKTTVLVGYLTVQPAATATSPPIPTATSPPTSTATLTATATSSPPATATSMSSPTAAATTTPINALYVSMTGNDANPGTAALPFRTIQKGLNVAQPGNTVIVRPGTYVGAVFVRSGTAALPITLRAEFPATTAAVESRTVLQGSGSGEGLRIPALSYLVIDGFEIVNFEVGMFPSGATSNLFVTRNILRSNTAVGVQCASCSSSRFEGNAFLDPGGAFPAAAVQDYGLNFYGGTDNTVTGNYFFGKHNQALSLKHGVGRTTITDNTFEGCMYTCLYLGQNDDNFGGSGDLTSYGVMVERNVFRDAVDAQTGAYYRMVDSIVIRNVQDATVRNNVIENGAGTAIYVHGCDESCSVYGRTPTRATMTGNVILYGKGSWPAFRLENRGYSGDTLTIANNTVYKLFSAFEVENGLTVMVTNNNFVNVLAHAVWGTMPATAFAANNWYVLGDASIDTRQGTTDKHVDPLFAGPLTAFDPYAFRGPRPVFVADASRTAVVQLRNGSPLLDAGVSVGLPYQGTAPDIGAGEFFSS